MYKKEKKDLFIDSFSKYKKLRILRKPRSPLTILFCTIDLPDEWLIDIVEFKTKTKLITDNYMINEKQVETFIELYERHGFVEESLTLI